ncbi:hypothetical protein M5689_015304 [Euphorbia peplus]|nr:hypothetical protein M5689_015304 [Euphorbia peplus]
MSEQSLIIVSKQEKGVCEEEDVPSLSSTWSQLPPDLVSQISSHVFRGGDVGVLGLIPSVCKSWSHSFDINHTTSLIKTFLRHPPLKPLPPEYPCLIALKGTLCRFYHPSYSFALDFPELSGFYIQFSKFGWLLLCSIYSNPNVNSNLSHTYFFFNPYTRHKIHLPPSDYFHSMCFSSPPISPDCFVIGMRHNKFGITKRGEKIWVFYESLKTEICIPCCHLVLCGECCYVVGNDNGYTVEDDNKIRVIDLKKKSMKFLGKSTTLNDNVSFLVENGAQLLAVMVANEEQNVSIKRMIPSRKEWLPVGTLKNKMLFVSSTSSMLKPAPVEASSNKVYFPKILNEKQFVPYCLATKRYMSFLGDYAKGSPWSENEYVTEWHESTWIETMPFEPACDQQIDW